jgi:cell division protein ZapA (FtsZ GTPase activity inhibitor)
MALRQNRIDVLGTSFTIQTDEDPEYFESLLAYLKKTVDSVRRGSGVVDPLKIAILANLYAADELFRERRKSGDRNEKSPDDRELAEAERITLKLIASLDEKLR